MAQIVLDDIDKAWVLCLANNLRDGQQFVEVVDLPSHDELGFEKLMARITRFKHLGLADWHSQQSLVVRPPVLEIAHQIENPPPRDYWEEITKWFRGRWWSLPFIAIFVLLPLVWKWIEMLRDVGRWFKLWD